MSTYSDWSEGHLGFEPLVREVTVEVRVGVEKLAPEVSALLDHLGSAGCRILRCPTFAAANVQATQAVEASSSDVVVLVVLRPENTVQDVRNALAVAYDRRPVLVGPSLAPEEIVGVLADGASDYIPLSENPFVAAARLLSVARSRTSGIWRSAPHGVCRVGTLNLDLASQALSGPGGRTYLTDTEARIFVHLAERPGASAEEVARTVLGRRDVVGRGRDLAYRHIANLRTKLRAVGASKTILRDQNGYRLE